MIDSQSFSQILDRVLGSEGWRACIHLHTGDGKYVQHTDYAGNDQGGAGRVFSEKYGIVGLAVKLGGDVLEQGCRVDSLDSDVHIFTHDEKSYALISLGRGKSLYIEASPTILNSGSFERIRIYARH